MRLTISTDNKRFSTKLEDAECDALFVKLVMSVIDPEKFTQKSSSEKVVLPEAECPAPESPIHVPETGYSEEQPRGHKGFLYVRCPKCGKEHGFCVKFPITSCTCKSCGSSFPLPDDMAQVSFTCECGHDYRYETNIEDAAFEMPCLNCGSPVSLEYNPKSKSYQGMK